MGILGGLKGVIGSLKGKKWSLNYPENLDYQKIQKLMDSTFEDSMKYCAENDCDICYYDNYYQADKKLKGKNIGLKIWTMTYKDHNEDDLCCGANLLLSLSNKELKEFKRSFVKDNNLIFFPDYALTFCGVRPGEIELGGSAKMVSYFLSFLGVDPAHIEWTWIKTDKELENNDD